MPNVKTEIHFRFANYNITLSARKRRSFGGSKHISDGLIYSIPRGIELEIKCIFFSFAGEESLTIFLDKQKLNKKSEGNSNSSVVSLELLHQLAASYFTDRESTLRRLHHLQIATSAIKVLHTLAQQCISRCIWFASVLCWQMSVSGHCACIAYKNERFIGCKVSYACNSPDSRAITPQGGNSNISNVHKTSFSHICFHMITDLKAHFKTDNSWETESLNKNMFIQN